MSLYQTHHAHQSEIVKIWTKQLYKEVHQILFEYKLKMKAPIICIKDMTSTLGEWDSQTKTISISKSLIESEDWRSVLEVLKHEMAHQYVFEILNSKDAHGSDFKLACERLRVTPLARKAHIQIQDLRRAQPLKTPEEERLDKKIKKLLALTNSPNEHEAFLAMKTVKDIYEKYHLQNIFEGIPPEYSSVLIHHKKKTMERYKCVIVSILVTHFPVKAIYTSIFDAKECAEFKAVELFGSAKHISFAEYIYWFLHNNLKLLWEQYKDEKKLSGLSIRNSYYLGILKGFDKKLTVESQQPHPLKPKPDVDLTPKSDLIKVSNKNLERYINYCYPRISNTKQSEISLKNEQSYTDGFSKGLKLNVRFGLPPQKETKGLAIES